MQSTVRYDGVQGTYHGAAPIKKVLWAARAL